MNTSSHLKRQSSIKLHFMNKLLITTLLLFCLISCHQQQDTTVKIPEQFFDDIPIFKPKTAFYFEQKEGWRFSLDDHEKQLLPAEIIKKITPKHELALSKVMRANQLPALVLRATQFFPEDEVNSEIIDLYIIDLHTKTYAYLWGKITQKKTQFCSMEIGGMEDISVNFQVVDIGKEAVSITQKYHQNFPGNNLGSQQAQHYADSLRALF